MTSLKCMIDDLIAIGIKVVDVECDFDCAAFDLYTPPCIDYCIDIECENELSYKFECETEGITESDGAGGDYGFYKVNIFKDGVNVFTHTTQKSIYGLQKPSEVFDEHAYDFENEPWKYINRGENEEENERLRNEYDMHIHSCVNISRIIEKYISKLYIMDVIGNKKLK